ncbi:winged helix-turn-helix domain-containing protein [Brevibacillus daliensis]|uniref:winged helix-turn-helix domain-containing protein n=1 Tax=Brevibacillus daliensis TaxID=2892995 RepID=UPI001E5A5F45|nr:winged helix-turn-helix domain-containing protein [Brevibacillus daliensis]
MLFHDNEYIIELSGGKVQLLPKEYALLRFLYQHAGQIFTREELLNQVWRMEEPVDRTVDDHIYRLRKKLTPYSNSLSIETIRGRGYRLQKYSQQEETSAVIQEPLLTKKTRELIETYHYLGMGDQMVAFTEQMQKLGVPIRGYYSWMQHVVKGDISRVVGNNVIPFWERAFTFFSAHFLITDDYMKSFTLAHILLDSKKMPPSHAKELEVNLVTLNMLVDRQEEAEIQLSKLWGWVRHSQEENGWLIFIIQMVEIGLAIMKKDVHRAEKSLMEAKDLLITFPGLRERGSWYIMWALYLSLSKKQDEAVLAWKKGAACLEESCFVPAIFSGLTMSRQICLGDPDFAFLIPIIEQKWEEQCEKYKVEEWRAAIKVELQANLKEYV